MIIQLPSIILDCPVCGRPVEIQSIYLSRELACDHCSGQFVVDESVDGKPVAASCNGHDLLKRTDQLLPTTRFDKSLSCSTRSPRSPSIAGSASNCDSQSVLCVSPEEDCRDSARQQPTVLLVEHRDKVYARLATDMSETGMHVVRAKTAVEALKLFGRCVPRYVVANLDLPDQSGWLLACKLRFCKPDIHVWLYQADSSSYDAAMTRYLQINEVLNYGGNLLGLSESIVELIAKRRKLFAEECGAEQVEEATTA